MTKTAAVVSEVLQLAAGKSSRQKSGKSKDMKLPEAFGETLRTTALAGNTRPGRDVKTMADNLSRLAGPDRLLADMATQTALVQAMEAALIEQDAAGSEDEASAPTDEDAEAANGSTEPALAANSGGVAARLSLLLSLPVAPRQAEQRQPQDHAGVLVPQPDQPSRSPGRAAAHEKSSSMEVNKDDSGQAEFDLPEQAKPLPVAIAEAGNGTAIAAKTAETPDLAAEPQGKLVPITLTRVETSLPPSMLPAGTAQPGADSSKSAQPAVPVANPVMPALPQPTVVRSIEFRLQPDHLGDVKVAMHLKGEELRLSVEVSTHEAHALLQRDRSALRDVLEKAGYDLAETAVAVTIRPDALQLQPSSSTTGDNLSFQRNGNGAGGGETQQQPAHGDQSRQPGRQPAAEKESQHGFAHDSQKRKDIRQPGAGGIYL